MSFCSTQFYPSHIPEIAHFFPLKNFPKNLKFPQIANFFSKSKSQPNCRSQSVELLDPTEGICRKPSAVDIIYNISLQIVRACTFSYSARTSSCDSKSSKAYNFEQIQDSHSKNKKHHSNSLGSSSQNSESSDTQELYLELRLSL
ncbi:uncharacterized protein LOC108458093 isoform X3 [Gossypium arboreum]|uniref:uncharacterized protein LOC108458093 isoform X3 n=1 Tax=Gossypium arboreum TaxID=29729 RepID=UPI0022F1A54A|nr:uncharacterized protein LOC108458093 isoform X3 [Gossypium arboreum]